MQRTNRRRNFTIKRPSRLGTLSGRIVEVYVVARCILASGRYLRRDLRLRVELYRIAVDVSETGNRIWQLLSAHVSVIQCELKAADIFWTRSDASNRGRGYDRGNGSPESTVVHSD